MSGYRGALESRRRDSVNVAIDVRGVLGKAVVRPDDDAQGVRMGDGQGTQERGVDEAEDCGVRADADGQRQDDGEREGRCPADLAEAVTRVGKGRVEPPETAGGG